MEKVINALEEIQKMDCAYGIPVDGICSLREEITEAKVCTPVIGKFSSGKSALVNTLLGYTKRILHRRPPFRQRFSILTRKTVLP